MESLCPKCQKFYGNPLTLNFCSSCYKQHLKTESVLTEAHQFKIPSVPVQRQVDHSRCYSCRKKVGLLGVRCTGCDCSYCNTHRLPEHHHCDAAFLPTVKQDPKKLLCSIVPSKIEKI